MRARTTRLSWRLALAGLLLAGCASSAPVETNHVADSGAAEAGQAGPKGSPTPPPVPSTGNPNRLNQLAGLKTTTVTVKGHPIRAWIMDDEGKREEGMMMLTDAEVKPDEGMLFVFDEVQRKADGRGFWMHNTLIPLDIVYLTGEGRVVNIANGKPQDDTSLPAAGDFQYVLEMKAGTAKRFGLKPGDAVPIPKL